MEIVVILLIFLFSFWSGCKVVDGKHPGTLIQKITVHMYCGRTLPSLCLRGLVYSQRYTIAPVFLTVI